MINTSFPKRALLDESVRRMLIQSQGKSALTWAFYEKHTIGIITFQGQVEGRFGPIAL